MLEGPPRGQDGKLSVKKTYGRSLGSYDAVEPVRGTCHDNGCRRETTCPYAILCTKTRWSSITNYQVLHHAVASSLRHSNVLITIEDTWPCKQRGTGQQARLNPMRMDTSTEAEARFGNGPRLNKSKALLLDLIIVNPYVSSNVEGAARQTGKHLADAVERKEPERGRCGHDRGEKGRRNRACKLN